MTNAPAFLYSSVRSGWTNELNGVRYTFPTLNPIISGNAGSPTSCDAVGISMPDADGTLMVYSSTDGSTWTLRVAAAAYKMRNSLTLFDSVSAQFWYVQAVGFSSVSVIKIGAAVRMNQNNYQGVAPPAFNQSVSLKPDAMTHGQWLGRHSFGRTAAAAYNFDHITTAWLRANAVEMLDALRNGAGVFYAWRPQQHSQEVLYGHLSSPTQIINTGTRNFVGGAIAIDGVYDGNFDDLPMYSVTPPA